MSDEMLSEAATERLARMADDLAVLVTAATATNTDYEDGDRRDKLLRSLGYHRDVAATLRALAARVREAEAERDEAQWKTGDAETERDAALASLAAERAAAWIAGRDAAADYVDECLAELGLHLGTASVRALTPPADLAASTEARIDGE